MYWLHSWTLNFILKKVIQTVARNIRPTDIDTAMDNVTGAAERTAAWLKQAHGYFDGIGTGLRRVVGWPVMLLLTMFFVLLALPLVAVWWLT